MTATQRIYLLPLDEEWRPVARLDGTGNWGDIIDQLLHLDSAWLVVEEQRLDYLDEAPAREDIRLSRLMSRRLRPMDIKLVDHVIQGPDKRFSFREAGLL